MRREEKLVKGEEFKRVFDGGEAHSGRKLLRAFVLKRGGAGVKVGIITGKKIGGAVKRNRAKRLLREGFRKIREKLIDGQEIVLVPKSMAAEAKLSEIEDALKEALIRAKSFKHE